MPDGMTPENKSPNFNLGMDEAKNFPLPEWKSDMPDIRMQLRDDEDTKDREAADALHHRIYYGHESLSSEMISGAETPQELFYGLRQLEKQLEDASIPFSLEERYSPPRELSVMYERKDLLSLSAQDLLNRGWIRKYDEKTTLATLRNRRYASISLSVEDVPNGQVDRFGNEFTVQTYKLGSPEKRAELAKAYDRAIHELEARSIMGEHISLRTNLDFRDNLEGLVSTLHGGRMPKFKSEHLEALFNMPDIDELAKNPENHTLGDRVEEAIFLNLVMLNSGNKQRMKDFLDRPGAKFLIAKLAKEKGMKYEEWKDKYIGKVESWVDDSARDLKKTWREEQNDGRRGLLTRWSNICAWGGNPSEFGADKEIDFIEGTIGDLVGSKEASWIAATMMRVIGAYASEGYVALPNGKSLLPLGEGRYISGDDTGKFYAYMFNMKEGLKGRVSGLKDMIGRIPDMAMNLFDWAGVEMDDLPPNPDGSKAKRSIWDAWLGTAGGKPKMDLVTGKPTQNRTTEEPYHRLGSLNYKSLERDFHGTFTIMQWLMGNGEGPTGVYVDAQKVDFEFKDFTLNELKKKIKYIGIVMNPVVLTKGSPQIYDNINCEKIQENFFRNLMSARIRSVSFNTKILNQKINIFSPGITSDDYVDVSAAKLVELNINEAVKGLVKNPSDQDELMQHYIDNNVDLRRQIATKDEIAEVVTKTKLEENVGKVTGRKIR